MLDEPHGGNLALDLGPNILNHGLQRDSDNPRSAVVETSKEAHIEASTALSGDAAGLLPIVLRSETANSPFVYGGNECLNSFVDLLYCEREWRAVFMLGTTVIPIDRSDRPFSLLIMLLWRREWLFGCFVLGTIGHEQPVRRGPREHA